MAQRNSMRWLASIAGAVAALGSAPAALAQLMPLPGETGFQGGYSLGRAHNPVGFKLARAEYQLPCSITVLHCRNTDVATQYSRNWSLELGLQDLGRTASRPWSTGRAQGLSLSLLGRSPVPGLEQLNVYGKFGTTYGFTEPGTAAATAAAESGMGLSYGAGLSLDFTPRLSATLGWDAHDFRFSNGLRDVRATSIGIQYRY